MGIGGGETEMSISKRGRIAIGVLAFALLAAIATGGWHYWQGHRANDLVLHGNVDIRQVDLAFRVGGRIAEVLVDEGDKVEKGQPLARLDKDLLAQQVDAMAAALEQQEANLARLEKGYRTQEIAQARASLASATASAENARLNLERVSVLRGRNAVSQKELDNARAAEREAGAARRSAQEQLDMLLSGYREEEVLAQKAAVDAARAQLKKAEIQLEDAVLLAPQSGIIQTRAREAGAIVGEGQTIYTMTLVDPVWLRVYVSEPYLGLVKPGMPVSVSVDSAPGKTFPGKVGFISPTAEFTPKTVETKEVRSNLVYRVRVQADDPENLMRQGMPVTVSITSGNQPDE